MQQETSKQDTTRSDPGEAAYSSDAMVNYREYVESLIQQSFGMSLQQLLTPIGETGVGENVRHNGVYFNIRQARQQDDPTLPTGVWQHDLKVADWQEVKNIALDALCKKSKDLQLGVWLLEANIQLQGFAGVAPTCYLIVALCQEFWQDIHPKIEDDDLEYRTNPIAWIDTKITPQLRLLPLIKNAVDGGEMCWDDWECAHRNEQLRAQNQLPDKWKGMLPKDYKLYVQSTDAEFLKNQFLLLQQASDAVEFLQNWFNETCDDESPSLQHFAAQLQQISEFYLAELTRRGFRLAEPGSDESAASSSQNDNAPVSSGGGGDDSPPGKIDDINNREQAFVCLQKAAQYLLQDDPHSIVPYLVLTACEWGQRAAPDLYQEVFLKRGGQLNVFEIMGVNPQD